MRKSKLKDLKLKEFDNSLIRKRQAVNKELDAKITDLFNAILEQIRYESLKKEIENKKPPKKQRKPKDLYETFMESIRYDPFKQIKSINIEELQAKLKAYEALLDKKYWGISSMVFIRYYIHNGNAQTIEEAIALYEQRQSIIDS